MLRPLDALLGFALLPLGAAPQGVPTWTRVQLDPVFRSEGVAVADVNHDGRLDVLAGEVWYEAPLWQRHDLAPAGTYDPINGASDCFIAAAGDVDGDGWTDFLSVGFPGGEGRWFKNPHNAPGFWSRYVIAPRVCNESPHFVDVNGDGKLDLIMGNESDQRMYWLETGPDPTQPWIRHPISLPGQPGFERFHHGLGFGDVNGDGRRDVLVTEGWYEGPANPASSPWTFHPANFQGASDFGPQDAAQMPVYDFDGDGDNDVATSSPHAYGVWWWEQSNALPGSFAEHRICTRFSESHALELADIDGDGLADLVTGKRVYPHGPTGDPGAQDPAVLVWFQLFRTNGVASFVPHAIDASSNSGVGTQFVVVDVNADGRLDVVTSNKKGVYLFRQ